MCVKCAGSRTPSIILYLYFMCLWKFYTRELKMYGRQCFRRYSRLRIRYASENSFSSSSQSDLSCTIVFKFFFSLLSEFIKVSKSMVSLFNTFRT